MSDKNEHRPWYKKSKFWRLWDDGSDIVLTLLLGAGAIGSILFAAALPVILLVLGVTFVASGILDIIKLAFRYRDINAEEGKTNKSSEKFRFASWILLDLGLIVAGAAITAISAITILGVLSATAMMMPVIIAGSALLAGASLFAAGWNAYKWYDAVKQQKKFPSQANTNTPEQNLNEQSRINTRKQKTLVALGIALGSLVGVFLCIFFPAAIIAGAAVLASTIVGMGYYFYKFNLKPYIENNKPKKNNDTLSPSLNSKNTGPQKGKENSKVTLFWDSLVTGYKDPVFQSNDLHIPVSNTEETERPCRKKQNIY